MPTVSHVMRVVEAQLNAGQLQCLVPGCGGVLAPWWYGVERPLILAGGLTGRVRPRRAVCKSCGTTRVLLPDTMLRRRQCSVEVIGTALLHAAAGMPWTRVAAQAGVPFETVRGWLRRLGRLALSGQLYLRYFMLRAAGSGTRRGPLAESCNRVPNGDASDYSGSRCTGQCPPVLSFASGTRFDTPARP